MPDTAGEWSPYSQESAVVEKTEQLVNEKLELLKELKGIEDRLSALVWECIWAT